MILNNVKIKGKDYLFVKDYKDNEKLRHSFASFAQRMFGINFESWYEAGYWQDRYIPYSIVEDDKVIANVSANIIKFNVLGEDKLYIQIGTVMTEEKYRGNGLSRFLIEEIIKEWKDKSDLIYLFANDTVLNFYPKFGFKTAEEYEYLKNIEYSGDDFSSIRLNIDKKEDEKLLCDKIINSIPHSKLSMINNLDLIMFYLISMKDSIYYIEKYDNVVIADNEGDTLIIYDIFGENEADLNTVINSIATKDTKKVVLGFVPKDDSSYECKLFKEEDTTLFVLNGAENIFANNKLKFPSLSHA